MHSRVCTTVGIRRVSKRLDQSLATAPRKLDEIRKELPRSRLRRALQNARRARGDRGRSPTYPVARALLYSAECVDPKSWTTALLVPVAIAPLIETLTSATREYGTE